MNRQFLLRPPRPEGRNYPSFWVAARRAKGERPKAKLLHPKMKGNSVPQVGGPARELPIQKRRAESALQCFYSGSFGAQTVPLIVRGSESPSRRAASIPWSVSLEREPVLPENSESPSHLCAPALRGPPLRPNGPVCEVGGARCEVRGARRVPRSNSVCGELPWS